MRDDWPLSEHRNPHSGHLAGDAVKARADGMLVDTSVWVDHLSRRNTALAELLETGEAFVHSFVIGELVCGNLRDRNKVLELLHALPRAPVAEHEEVLAFVERHRLMGLGLGWVDMHLLASAALLRSPLWSLDRRLAAVARKLNLH